MLSACCCTVSPTTSSTCFACSYLRHQCVFCATILDSDELSRLEELELDPQIRLVVPPGGIILFSAAQMHSTVPNTSGRARYSIDFRTVNLADLRAGLAAPDFDS